MKKIFCIMLSLILAISLISSYGIEKVWDGTIADEFMGEGTKESPYLIDSGDELALLSREVYRGKSFKGKYFLLTEDILLNKTDNYRNWAVKKPSNEWKPIGGPTYSFSGVFDGGGHKVSGVYVSDENKSYLGLFGYIDGGEIKNLRVTESFVKGKNNIALLTGLSANSEISFIETSGMLQGAKNVGSTIGSLYKSKASYIESEADIEGYYYIGGIAGKTYDSKINSSAFSGLIEGKNGVGGIAGNSEKTNIENSYESADVHGKDYVGGITGHNDEDSKIFASYSLGEIKGDNAVGGIAGLNYGKIDSCFTKSSVTGEISGAVTGINSPLSEEEDLPFMGEIENTYYAKDKTETAVGHTVEEEELDIVDVSSSKLSGSYISSFILEGEYISEEDRGENPGNVWVFEGKKGPRLFFENKIRPHIKEEESVETGKKIGEIVSTDIRAFINGSEIKSYNIEGRMAIAVKDLREFGFEVSFNEDKRTVSIEYKGGEINSSYKYEENTLPVGTYLKDILSTDIEAYINGEKTVSFNADGYTHIYFRSLSDFGEVSFDEVNKRAELNIK